MAHCPRSYTIGVAAIRAARGGTSQTRRSQDWYRIATFTGVAAYVSAALCTELGGQGTRGGR